MQKMRRLRCAALRCAFAALRPGGVLITHEPGEGHSTAPASIEAMRLYGVTERDMPPRLIIRRGREAGFGRGEVFPIPHDVVNLFYGRRPRILSRAMLSRLHWAFHIFFGRYDRRSAVVRLTKPR
jgi:hypothetical protein